MLTLKSVIFWTFQYNSTKDHCKTSEGKVEQCEFQSYEFLRNKRSNNIRLILKREHHPVKLYTALKNNFVLFS